jgi:hypothetical protein
MRKDRVIKKGASLLILCSLVILIHPLAFSEGVCEEALGRCAVETVISGIFGGIQAMAAHAVGCTVGYQWCLKYYVPEM